MLKVVGASWVKTRISTYILIGCGFLIIGAFFIAEMERPQYDGTYCATVYWTEKAGFKVEYWKQSVDLVNIPKGVARICYKDSTSENGWSQLEVETQRNYPDWVQAFGAGILEGSLTWKNIHHQWTNTIASACDRDENSQNFCTWMRDVLSTNYKSIKKIAAKRAHHDHYWHQIHLFYYQLEGLEFGWKKGAKRARSDSEIPSEDFLLMNSAADIQDLKIYFENYILPKISDDEVPSERNFLIPSASMILKLFQSNETGWNLLFGHSSAGSYSSMLRVQKRYKFRYHFYPDQKSSTVPGLDIMFTGYPGILASTDDFYIIKGRQVYSIVAGVGIRNENLKLWKNVNINYAVPLSARVMVANRLAQNRRTWARAMSRHPTTGNKQWILLDLRKIDTFDLHSTSNSSQINAEIVSYIRKGAVWVVEQLPGRFHAKEVTEEMTANETVWYGNGTPYFKEILEASRVSNKDNFSSDINSNEIMNLEEVDRYLRAHAFRGDLLDDQSIPYGNIDIKLFSYSSRTEQSDFHSIAGPLFMRKYQQQQQNHHHQHDSIRTDIDGLIGDDIVSLHSGETDLEIISERRRVRNDIRAMAMRRLHGPFKWSQANEQIASVKHTGHPDEWNFDKVSPKWAWHD